MTQVQGCYILQILLLLLENMQGSFHCKQGMLLAKIQEFHTVNKTSI